MDTSLTLRERRNLVAGVSERYLRGLQDRGVENFREGNFKGALQFFDEAIKQDAEAPLTILDKRAATYVKLGDVDQALSDAGRMIRRDQSNAVGYLRLGQILQVQSKPLKALKTYQSGIRKVSPRDPHVKTLQDLCNKLSGALAPRKAIDPFISLPEEIARMILAYIDFKDIVNLSRVCTSWRYMLIHNYTVWTNIDFFGSTKVIPSRTLREYVKRSQGKVKRLATNSFEHEQRASLTYVVRRCKELQEMCLHSGFIGSSFLTAVSYAPNLRTIIASSRCETTLERVTQIFGCCPNLERAEFRLTNARSSVSGWRCHMPKLVCLRLDNYTNVHEPLPLSKLLKNLPKIQSLRLRNFNCIESNMITDFSVVPQLTHLDITQSGVDLIRLPPSLCELNMADICFYRLRVAPITMYLKDQSLPSLVSLSLSRWNVEPSGFLRAWLDPNKGNLRQLDLSHYRSPTGSFLYELIGEGYLDNVKELKLNQCDLGDEVVELLAQKASHLRYLDLERTKVTGVGVKALITHLKGELQYLGLDSCSFTSFDAIEFARSEGLVVSFNFPDDSRKGKKIRPS